MIQNYSIYLSNLFGLLDNYLIKDLETLVNEIPARENGGGVGYPALHTILSGMELLGMILSGEEGSKAFEYYWDNYLIKHFHKYDQVDLRKIFREVMRNGTAHLFLIKSGVTVSKDGRNHLKPVKHHGKIFFNVDLKDLHEHFLKTYQTIKDDLSNNQLPQQVVIECDQFEKQMREGELKTRSFINGNQIYTTPPSTTTTATSSTSVNQSSVTLPYQP